MTTYSAEDFNKAALQLCDYGKQCYQLGWSPATSSNYSIRLDQKHCALTSSGKHKGQLQPEDILVVNMQGDAVTSGKPSAETLLHTQLYLFDHTIGAVLHTHSPNAVLISHIHKQATLRIQGWELLKALSGITTHDTHVDIPIFNNTQDIAALANEVDTYMQQHKIHAYLIRGHGIYTWGKDIRECFRHLEALESLIHYELSLLKLE